MVGVRKSFVGAVEAVLGLTEGNSRSSVDAIVAMFALVRDVVEIWAPDQICMSRRKVTRHFVHCKQSSKVSLLFDEHLLHVRTVPSESVSGRAYSCRITWHCQGCAYAHSLRKLEAGSETALHRQLVPLALVCNKFDWASPTRKPPGTSALIYSLCTCSLVSHAFHTVSNTSSHFFRQP